MTLLLLLRGEGGEPPTPTPVPAAYVRPTWQEALEAATRTDVATCAAYLAGELLEELIVTDGSVSADCRRSIMRTGSLVVAPSDGRTHAETYDLLATPGLELRVRRGLQYADGLVETLPLASFVVDELSYVERAEGTELSVQCSDVSAVIQRAAFTDAYQLAGGGSLADLVTAALIDRYPLASIGFTSVHVPDDLAASVVLGLGSGSSPWAELQAVMLAHGYLLYLDAAGVIQATVPIDPVSGTVSYVYARGAAALVTERSRILPMASTYSGVVVTGEGSEVATPVRGEAWDDDPRSPTYYLGPFGAVPLFVSSPLVTSEAQAEAMALVQLTLLKGRRDQFAFSALVRPELAPLDLVAMERADGGLDTYVIDSVTTPLAPAAVQTAVTRSTVGNV